MIPRPVVSEQSRPQRRLLAVAMFALAASLPSPKIASAAAQLTCKWGYYAGGTGSFVPLFEDPDMTSPGALRLGRFFTNESPLSASGSLDFNFDNKTDVFRLAPRDSTTAWWQYSPDGASAWVYMAYSAESLDALRFGDLNADGYTDVLASIYNNGNYHWELSSAGISSYVDINSIATYTPIEIGQFDAGADDDVFFTVTENQSGHDTNRWKESSGGTAAAVNLAYSAVDPKDLRFGDFDGDGITDVFAALPEGGGNYQWVYSSAGIQSFKNLALTTHPLADLNFGDFNGDGVTDVFVAADQNDGSLRWEYWPSGLPNPVVLKTAMTTMPYVGDFNGDGVTDAFVARCNDTPRFVRVPSPRRLIPQEANRFQTFVADIDGDGDDDLVFDSTCQTGSFGTCALNNNNVTAVSLSNGDGSFVPLASQVLDSTNDWQYWRNFIGDIDGDGHADLLFAQPQGPGNTSLLASAKWNGSKFVLTGPVSIGTGLQQFTPALGDFDGDGKTDVLWSSTCAIGNGLNWGSCTPGDSNNLVVAFSTGSTFARGGGQTVGNSGWEDYTELIGDVNGDGKDDVIWNSTCQASTYPSPCDIGDNNYIRVGLGDGTGQFTVGNLQNFGSGWSQFGWPFTGDFNGDGKVDLAWYQPCVSDFCETSDNELRIALAGAGGSYLVLPGVSFGARNWLNYTLQPADVNGDGSDDLVWTATGTANDTTPVEILVALSNSDGTFALTPIEQFKGAFGRFAAFWGAGDLNGDGKADIVGSAAGDRNLEVFLSGSGVAAYCGNSKVENQETCDDGNNTWAPGQHCDATCHLLACGDTDNSGSITASDALFALRTSVGTKTCDSCICDVDHNGTIVVSDALRLLRKAVGQSVTLSCAACS